MIVGSVVEGTGIVDFRRDLRVVVSKIPARKKISHH